MKVCLYVLAVLCASALVTDGHQVKEGRTYSIPPCYVRAGKFLELSEFQRVTYTTGLLDGFPGSAMFGAGDDTVDRLGSCTKEMDSKQVTEIVSKYVTDHPETWHLPLSVEAFNALNDACPGGLRVRNRK